MVDPVGPQPETAAAVEALSRDGAFIWPGFLGEELQPWRSRARELLEPGAGLVRVYQRSRRVLDLFNDSFCRGLLSDSRLAGVVEALLHPGYLLSDFSLNEVPPSNAPDAWHVDYPYNEMEVRASGGVFGVQCIVALDDFTAVNGATAYLPGSHGRIDAVSSPADFRRFVAPAGSLLVLHSATWHRAGDNTSGSSRIGLLLCFVERWVRPMMSLRDLSDDTVRDATRHERRLLGLDRLDEVEGTATEHPIWPADPPSTAAGPSHRSQQP